MTSLRMAMVVGARPQFVKAAALWREVSGAIEQAETAWSLIHTGQHYDDAMSGAFFRDLDLPPPTHHLGVGSASHGAQTGEMMKRLEPVLLDLSPDVVLVVGDTNSTLAGALVAAKIHIPVAHVEAGLRSFNPRMPEEINRRLVDHLSDLLLCPSQHAADNLSREGITSGVHVTGDIMLEALQWIRPTPAKTKAVLEEFGLQPREYALVTLHRAENTNDEHRMGEIIGALTELGNGGLRMLMPLHPRTAAVLDSKALPSSIQITSPVGPSEMIALASEARIGLTDSGGLQKELYWLGVPCVTMRDETEWVETVEAGWNIVAGANRDVIVKSVYRLLEGPLPSQPPVYGDGRAARAVIELLVERYARRST